MDGEEDREGSGDDVRLLVADPDPEGGRGIALERLNGEEDRDEVVLLIVDGGPGGGMRSAGGSAYISSKLSNGGGGSAVVTGPSCCGFKLELCRLDVIVEATRVCI